MTPLGSCLNWGFCIERDQICKSEYGPKLICLSSSVVSSERAAMAGVTHTHLCPLSVCLVAVLKFLGTLQSLEGVGGAGRCLTKRQMMPQQVPGMRPEILHF